MTLDEAKRVLGLGPSEDPISHVEEFTKARDRIADMVRNAPNETIALRYQDGLLEFDKAMAAVREEIARKKAEKVAQLMALVPGSGLLGSAAEAVAAAEALGWPVMLKASAGGGGIGHPAEQLQHARLQTLRRREQLAQPRGRRLGHEVWDLYYRLR